MIEPWPVMFAEFLIKCTLELYEPLFCQDPEYISLNEELSRETEALIAGLGPEKLELYQNYESVCKPPEGA